MQGGPLTQGMPLSQGGPMSMSQGEWGPIDYHKGGECRDMLSCIYLFCYSLPTTNTIISVPHTNAMCNEAVISN